MARSFCVLLSALAGGFALHATAASAAPLREGDLLVLTDLGELASVDLATGDAAPFVSLPFPSGSRLAFDEAGDVLLRDRYTGGASRVDRDSGVVTPIAGGEFLEDSFGASTGIVADGAGGAFLTAQVSIGPGQVRGRVVHVDSGGAQDLVAEGFYLPTAIALEENGDLLVTSGSFVLGSEFYEGGVIRIDPSTGDESVVTSGNHLEAPIDLEVAPGGSILVLDLDRAIVIVDPLTGAQSLPPAPTSTEGVVLAEVVTGMSLDGAGGFHLTTGHQVFDEVFPGAVVHFQPGGALAAVTDPSEFFSPFDVAVVPAPEPAAPALLLGGALLLGLRRRGALRHALPPR